MPNNIVEMFFFKDRDTMNVNTNELIPYVNHAQIQGYQMAGNHVIALEEARLFSDIPNLLDRLIVLQRFEAFAVKTLTPVRKHQIYTDETLTQLQRKLLKNYTKTKNVFTTTRQQAPITVEQRYHHHVERQRHHAQEVEILSNEIANSQRQQIVELQQRLLDRDQEFNNVTNDLIAERAQRAEDRQLIQIMRQKMRATNDAYVDQQQAMQAHQIAMLDQQQFIQEMDVEEGQD